MTTVNNNISGSYVEWSAVIAGSVLACAISLLLVQFGNVMGFSVPSHYDETYTGAKVFIIGLWLLWVQLMASMAGAYLAGRMRRPWEIGTHESELRDGTHGLLTWALSSCLAAAAAVAGAMLAVVAQQYGIDTTPDNAEATISAAQAHKYAVIFGFSLTASSVVAAVAAWWMGTLGGDHRDRGAGAALRIYFRAR